MQANSCTAHTLLVDLLYDGGVQGGRLGGYRPPVNRMPRAGDPLKAVGFVKGGHKGDEMTDMEKNAAAFAKKHYKKKGQGQGGKASGSSAAGNKRRR
jgi:hypothetical protein